MWQWFRENQGVGSLLAFLVCIVLVAPVVYRNEQKKKPEWEQKQKRKLHNRFVRYHTSIITRKRFRRIVMEFSTLSCYEMDRVKEESVKLFEKAVGVAMLMPVVAGVAFRDVLLTLLVCGISYIYYDITVDRRIDQVYQNVVEEVSICIQSIREKYMETSNVATAVLNCEKGKYLSQPMTEVYQMLVDIDSEEKLYQFCRKSPVRIIKTLAMVCYIVNERGDVKDERGSAFADEMTSLRQEADMEIRRLKKIRIAFKSLSGLAIAGLVCQPVADMFLMSQIPGTATLIKGLYGYVEKTALIIVTILAYYRISTYTRSSVVNSLDRVQSIYEFSRVPRVKGFIKNLIPKKFKTRVKMKLRIQDAISSKTMEYIYTEKVVVSVIAFIGVFLLLLGFTASAKYYMHNNHRTLTFTKSAAEELTERAAERLYAVDEYYMSLDEKMEPEETQKYLRQHVPELTELQVINEADRLSTKRDKYEKIGFKWYYVLIAFAGGVVGWFAPEISLSQRKRLVQFEEVDDVMQLQTMMIALSQTTMDVSEVLYWLERQTTLHRAVLSRAMQEFTYQPIESLERLKMSVSSADFKRLVSKLEATVYNLPLKEAFSDMLLDKEQLMRVREMAQDEEISLKKQNASFLAQMPIFLVLLAGFVGPIIVLGFSEVMRVFSTVQ